ncbi:MAG: cytochrome c1, partial [Proteobacteria bacterium]|nr:cytochrome c1 [Pseudomonadota bacterium]
FTADKVGEQMKIALRPAEAKEWFGAAPPDLTVIARSRASEFGSGADWLYTYLRTFYRDPERPTGWNNLIFENVGMPHVLWQLQGEQVLHVEKVKDAHGAEVEHKTLQLAKPGQLTKDDYDALVADLVAYLVFMGEPMADTRKQIGIWVLIALAVLFGLSYALKKNYWKDIH